MTRLEIDVDEALAERIGAAAAVRGIAAAVLAESFPAPHPPSFIGVGTSGEGGDHIARRHQEIIREAFANKTARDV